MSVSAIYQTKPVFPDKDLLSAATEWTKKRIFSGGKQQNAADANTPGTASSGSAFDSPVAGPLPPNDTSILVSSAFIKKTFLVLVAYTSESVVKLFSCQTEGASSSEPLILRGSTTNIDGKIIKADIVGVCGIRVIALVQVVAKRATRLEVHDLTTRPRTSSLMHSLTDLLPGSGRGPFEVVTCTYDEAGSRVPTDDPIFAVVSANGKATLYLARQPKRCGEDSIDTCFGADSKPLMTISDSWIAYCPSNSVESSHRAGNAAAVPSLHKRVQPPTSSNAVTKVNYPPSGPLHQRLMESLSNTAITSLKTLSEAGLAGMRHYINDGSRPNTSYTPTDQSYGYEGDKESEDIVVSPATSIGSSRPSHSSFKALSTLVFGDSDASKMVHIVSFTDFDTLAYFPVLRGVSKLSFSPYEATLLVASSRGDYIDTYDLTFLPHEAVLKDVYIRGRLPGEITSVLWSDNGCFGITTKEKGSLHWFNKQASSNVKTRKLWKKTGWGIQNAGIAGSTLYVYRQGQIFQINSKNGQCTGKYDIPLEPATLTNNPRVTVDNEPFYASKVVVYGDPLSQYELETCFAYPYFHTDRRVTIKTMTDDDLMKRYTDGMPQGFGLSFETRTLQLGSTHGLNNAELNLAALAEAIEESYETIEKDSEPEQGADIIKSEEEEEEEEERHEEEEVKEEKQEKRKVQKKPKKQKKQIVYEEESDDSDDDY